MEKLVARLIEIRNEINRLNTEVDQSTDGDAIKAMIEIMDDLQVEEKELHKKYWEELETI